MKPTPPQAHSAGQPIGAPVPDWVPRPLAGPVTLTGRYATLAPLSTEHFEGLYDATCGPGDDNLWTYLFQHRPADRAESDALLSDLVNSQETQTYAIVPTGAGAIGRAVLMRIDTGNGVLEVGNIIYGPALQRTPAATEAMWLLMKHVFDDLSYRRYEWKLDSLNAASAAAARRLGFSYEGRFRQAVVYKGRNRDTDWFAMTDGDFEQLRPAYEQWLEPSNFDEYGHQRVSLSALTGPSASSGVPG